MNYYSHHIGDFRSATSHMDRLERALYREMLDIYYDNEAPLPLEKATIYRKTAARSEEDRAAVDALLSEFFTQESDGYHNKRADKEIAAYHAKADVSRENGKLGGRPRKPIEELENPEITKQVITDNPGQSHAKADRKATSNQEPVTSNQTNSKAVQRGSRLPADWFPTVSDIEYFQNKRPELALDAIAEGFRDYWLGSGKVKADWAATWRVWVQNQKGPPSRAAPSTPTKFDPVAHINRPRNPAHERTIDIDQYGEPILEMVRPASSVGR